MSAAARTWADGPASAGGCPDCGSGFSPPPANNPRMGLKVGPGHIDADAREEDGELEDGE